MFDRLGGPTCAGRMSYQRSGASSLRVHPRQQPIEGHDMPGVYFHVRGITSDGATYHDEKHFTSQAEAIAYAKTFTTGGFDRLEVWEMDGASKLRSVQIFPTPK